MSGPIVAWRVSNYSRKPARMEFLRETEHFYIRSYGAKEQRVAKETSWKRYYPTEEAALAAIAARNSAEEERRKKRQIEEAATDLLETLQAIAKDCRRGAHEQGMSPAGVHDIAARCDAAIARATGEQP